jgi:hypothetical protein
MSALVTVLSNGCILMLSLTCLCSIKRKIAHLCMPGSESEWGSVKGTASPEATFASLLPGRAARSGVDIGLGRTEGLSNLQSDTDAFNFLGMLLSAHVGAPHDRAGI